MIRETLGDLIEWLPDATLIVDREGRIVCVNALAEKLFRYSRAELLGRSMEILMPDRFQKNHAGHRAGYFENPWSRPMGAGLELSGRRKGGEEFPAEVSLSPLRSEEGVLVMSAIRDITERKRAEEAMSRLNAQLETANKELEAFSYSVSHDLRAPLRHIGGFIDILRRHAGPRLDEKSLYYIDTIFNAAERMGKLIDDLLTFSRTALTEMRIGSVALDALVQEVVESLRPEVEGREILWTVGSLPAVEGDAAMLRQVWANLIGNAVKYTRTRACAEIEIGCRLKEHEFVFFVRDNGVGYQPEYADKLFGVFQRLHPVDEFEGTGIGLANVRRIVHRHGGRTWSEGQVDRGAVFYFSLPNGNQASVQKEEKVRE